MRKFQKTQQGSVPVMKRTIKDSVFTDLFKDKKYLIQLYQALHPDDKQTTEDDIHNSTKLKMRCYFYTKIGLV